MRRWTLHRLLISIGFTCKDVTRKRYLMGYGVFYQTRKQLKRRSVAVETRIKLNYIYAWQSSMQSDWGVPLNRGTVSVIRKPRKMINTYQILRSVTGNSPR